MTFLPTFLAAALALGQLQPLPGRIEGLVVAEREGGQVPLPFALVAVAGAQRPRTILTDSAGRYALEDLPPGTYGVRVSHIGYKQGAVEVIVPEGSTVQVDLGLAWAPLRLPALRVSMTPREMPPLAMRAAAGGSSRSRAELTLRALEASPGLAEAGLGEAARRLPGNEPRDPTDVLFMRGSTADLKLVLLDGAPVYTPFHLGGLLASFDATSLGDATHHVGGAPRAVRRWVVLYPGPANAEAFRRALPYSRRYRPRERRGHDRDPGGSGRFSAPGYPGASWAG